MVEQVIHMIGMCLVIFENHVLIAGGLDINHISKLKYLKLGQSGYDIASGIETDNIKDLAK